jgi:hypothetical protein
MTDQKEPLHQEEILQKAANVPIAVSHPAKITANVLLKNDLFLHQGVSHTKANKVKVINLQAVSAAAKKSLLRQRAGPIPGARQITMTGQKEVSAVNRQVEKKHLPPRAGHIPAG